MPPASALYSPTAAPRLRLLAQQQPQPQPQPAAPSLPQPLPALAPHDSKHSAIASDEDETIKPSRRSMHAHSRSEVGNDWRARGGGGGGGGEGPDVLASAAFPVAIATPPLHRARRNSFDTQGGGGGGIRSGQSSPSVLSCSPVQATAASMLLRADESKLLSPPAGSIKANGLPAHPPQLPRTHSTSKSISGIDALDWFRDAPVQPPPHGHGHARAQSLSRRSLGGSNDFGIPACLLPSLSSAVPAVISSKTQLVARKSSTPLGPDESSLGPEQHSTPVSVSALHNLSRARVGHARSPKLSPRATPTPPLLLQQSAALALDDGEGKLSSPQKAHDHASTHLRSFNNSRASSPMLPQSLPPISGSHSSCSSPAPQSRRMSPAVVEQPLAATPRLSFGASSSNARLRKPLPLSVYDFSPAGGGSGSGSGSASACGSGAASPAPKATMSPTGLVGAPLFYTNRSPQQLATVSGGGAIPSQSFTAAAAPAAFSSVASPSGLAKVTRAFSGVRASLQQGHMSGPVSSNASPNVTPKLGSRTLARIDRPSSLGNTASSTPEAAAAFSTTAAAASAPNSGPSSAGSSTLPSPALLGGSGRITGGAQASLFGGSPSGVARRISPVKINLGAGLAAAGGGHFQSSNSTSPVSSHPVSPTKTLSFAAAMAGRGGHMLSAPLGDRVAIGGGGSGAGSSRTSLSPRHVAVSSPPTRSPTASPLLSSHQTPEQQRTVPASPAESVPSSPMHLLSLAALSRQSMPLGLPPTPPPHSDVSARASPPPSAAASAAPQPFAVSSSDRPSPARLRFLPPPISLPVLNAAGAHESEQQELTPSCDSRSGGTPDSARSLRDEDIEAAMAKVARKLQLAAEDEARFAAAMAMAAAEADEIDTQRSPSPACSPIDDSSSSSVSLPFELPAVFVQASRIGGGAVALESPSPSSRRKRSVDGQSAASSLLRRVRSDDEDCEAALLREVQAATLAASQAASPIGPITPASFDNASMLPDSAAPFTFVLPDAPRASFHNYARASLDESALSSPGNSPGSSLAMLPQPPRSPPHSRPASAQGLVIRLTRPDSENSRRLHSPHEGGQRDLSSEAGHSPAFQPRALSFGADPFAPASSDDLAVECGGGDSYEDESGADDAADFWDAMDSGAIRFF